MEHKQKQATTVVLIMPEERGEDLSASAGSEDNDMSARTGRFSATPNEYSQRHMLEEGVILILLMDSERLHRPQSTTRRPA